MHKRRPEHESCSEADAARTNLSLAPSKRRDDGLAANGNGGGRRNSRRRFFIHRRIEPWINLRTNFRPNHHTGSDHHTRFDLARNQHAGIDHDDSGHNHSGSRNRCSHAGYSESNARNSQPWNHHTSDFTDHSNPGDNTHESDPGDHSEQPDSRDDSGHNHSRDQQSWKHQSWNYPSGRQPDFADPGDNEST